MGRIAVVENPLRPEDAKLFTWNGQYIDFLIREYPTGFSGPHQTMVNGEMLKVVDYDRCIDPEDNVLLMAFPGAIPAAFAVPLIMQLVGVAISLVLSAIFTSKPKNLKSLTNPAPSPVYSLDTPTNQARLGKPVPAIYGQVVATPDIASQPHQWFDSNEQFTGILLCLGNGEFDIEDLIIADSLVSQLSGSTFQYWVYGPTDHNSVHGTIETATGVYEDVDTSPEAGDQELEPPNLITRTATVVFATKTLTLTDALPSTVEVGNNIVVTEARTNDGTYTSASISADRKTIVTNESWTTGNFNDTNTTVWAKRDGATTFVTYTYAGTDEYSQHVGDAVTLVLNNTSPPLSTTVTGTVASTTTQTGPPIKGEMIITLGSITGNPLGTTDTSYNTGQVTLPLPTTGIECAFSRGDGTIGPFIASRSGTVTDKIQVDFIFPGGLYQTNSDGELIEDDCDITVTIEEIDDSGSPTGSSTAHNIEYKDSTNQTLRFTEEYSSPYDRCRVKCKRTDNASEKAADNSTVIWAGLKAILEPVSTPVYGDVTLIMCKVQATNGLASDALNRIGVKCTRKLNGTATKNAADAFEDIILNTDYGAQRPSTEIDTAALARLRGASAAGDGFNAIFDTHSTVWEALELVTQIDHAYPITLGAQFSSVIDKAQTTTTFSFDQNTNIRAGSLVISFALAEQDDFDGFEIEYRDPENFTAKYELYPSTSVNPEKVVLFGSANQAAAQSHAERLWLRKTYRRKFVKFETELDGHVPLVGDLVSVTHSLVPAGENYVIQSVSPADPDRVLIEAYAYDSRTYP